MGPVFFFSVSEPGDSHRTLLLCRCLGSAPIAPARHGLGLSLFHPKPYLNLPKPTFLWVLIISPNMEFIGTLQKIGFGRLRYTLKPKTEYESSEKEST